MPLTRPTVASAPLTSGALEAVTPPAPTSEAVASGGTVTSWTFSTFTDPDGRIASYSDTLTAVVGSGSLSGSGLGPYSLTGTADGDAYTVELDALDSDGNVLATATHSVAIAAGAAPYRNDLTCTLDGVDDYVEIPVVDTPQTTDAFTVSAWVAPDNAAEPVFSLEGSSQGVSLFFSARDLRLRLQSSASDQKVWSSSNVGGSTPDPFHILVAYNNGSVSMYKDGVLVSNSLIVNIGTIGAISYSTGYLGRWVFAGTDSRASMNSYEHVAYWDTDQSGNVANIFNAYDPPDLSALATPPTAWWPMTHSADDYTGTGRVVELIAANDGTAQNFAADPVRPWREAY